MSKVKELETQLARTEEAIAELKVHLRQIANQLSASEPTAGPNGVLVLIPDHVHNTIVDRSTRMTSGNKRVVPSELVRMLEEMWVEGWTARGNAKP